MCIKGCGGIGGGKKKNSILWESHNTGQFIADCNLARHTDKTRQGKAASNPKEYRKGGKQENMALRSAFTKKIGLVLPCFLTSYFENKVKVHFSHQNIGFGGKIGL